MKFKPKLTEIFREHTAKHAKGAAIAQPSPYALGLATATEAEFQRFADHIERNYQKKTVEGA